jgi:hypothetical protein
MAFKAIITGFVLAYFLIVIHLTLNVESQPSPEYSNSYSLQRTRRQIPFFSNWWSSSSTNKPGDQERKNGHLSALSNKASYNYGSHYSDRLPSYHNSTHSGNEITERDSRCKNN